MSFSRFQFPAWRQSRLLGLALVLLGGFAVVSPFFAAEWTLASLGLVVVVSALLSLARAVFARSDQAVEASYLQSLVLLALGLLLFGSPAFVLGGLFALIGVLLVLDGAVELVSVARRRGKGSLWEIFNGVLHVASGAFLVVYRNTLGPVLIGVVVGLWLVSLGWEMIFSARDEASGEPAPFSPAARLGMEDEPELARLAGEATSREADILRIDVRWCIGLGLIAFAIHIGRMDLRWNVLGVTSTLVAIVGDLMFALVFAIAFVLPIRLMWRWLTRGLERSAWRRRLGGASSGRLGDRLAIYWLDGRLRFDARLHRMRGSAGTALARVIQLGIPIAALLVAINPIWGFSWFFNTESWVSGFWQKLVEQKVDPWRTAMITAVAAQQGAPSVDAPGLFEVKPDGVAGATDFSFLVLGDTGEGDASQFSLKDRFLLEGQRDDVKFLVVSSDVIYPAGAMKDYEPNFYLPFKGFEKPILAIPGNHDWFAALDAFNANFLEPDAAKAAMQARLRSSILPMPDAGPRIDALVAEAGRLRSLYHIKTGQQRAPFFEIHGAGFSLISVDTGILKRIDEDQRRWLIAALERAKGSFTMVILGHPIYAAGEDMGKVDPVFGELHDLMRQYEIPIVLAGDTHDFEYYRETYSAADGARTMHHFVDGGGGAYLSIGTALDWPEQPPTPEWAYYPSTAAMREKLGRETPAWKRPFWWWLNAAGGWPGSIEGLSGAFDFNRAPFFQSFVEVKVQGSARRVVVALHGVDGPLRWRDIDRSGGLVPPDKSVDDPVEFVVPMDGQ